MSVKVEDVMTSQVVTAQPHHSVDHVRAMMSRNHCNAIPVVGPDDEPVGIVSATDLIGDNLKGGTPISGLMSEKVYTVPRYEGPHIAARVMRNHHIHHLVVTHEGAVVGMLSSFDLLELIEDHRFTTRQLPTAGRRANHRA